MCLTVPPPVGSAKAANLVPGEVLEPTLLWRGFYNVAMCAPGGGVADSVDEEGRSSVHPAAHSGGEVFPDPGLMDPICQLPGHAVGVHSRFRSVTDQAVAIELALVGEKALVHGPELPLSAGSLRCLRGGLRVRVDLTHREMPKNKAQPRSETRLHFPDNMEGAPAVRTLVIAVFDQGDRRVDQPGNVISITYRENQTGDFGRHAGGQAS